MVNPYAVYDLTWFGMEGVESITCIQFLSMWSVPTEDDIKHVVNKRWEAREAYMDARNKKKE